MNEINRENVKPNTQNEKLHYKKLYRNEKDKKTNVDMNKFK